jgi:hypothetical protein
MATEKRVRIIADHDPINPREWECNAGRMICWHDRYNLGDDHNYADPAEFMEELACEADDDLMEELYRLKEDVWNRLYDRAVDAGRDDPFNYAERLISARIEKLVDNAVRDGYVILPLFLYDHSGITMSVGGFSCPWDSGQVGWIVCDKETIEKEWNGDRDLAEKCLIAEVATYDDYLTGNVYGFIVEEREEVEGVDWCDDEGWEDVDSCWGFYGYDVRKNGMADHLESEELVELAACAEVEYR